MRRHECCLAKFLGFRPLQADFVQGKLPAARAHGASPSGGVRSRHSWQPESRSIGAVSYIPVQLFEYSHHRNWKSRHTRNAALDTVTFARLSSHSLLCLVKDEPQLSIDGRTLTLQPSSHETFLRLTNKLQQVQQAVHVLQKRKGGKATEASRSDSEGS